MMFANSTTFSTGGRACPRCGWLEYNCYCGAPITGTYTTLRNWREDDDAEPPGHWDLITPNDRRDAAPLQSFSGPRVRLWPEARAPPRLCCQSARNRMEATIYEAGAQMKARNVEKVHTALTLAFMAKDVGLEAAAQLIENRIEMIRKVRKFDDREACMVRELTRLVADIRTLKNRDA